MQGERKSGVLQKRVRIERVYPDNLATHFVTSFVAQHQPDHFVISFFELFMPPILGETAEERQRIVDEIDGVQAKCVARIVVTPDKMRELVSVLSDNLETYHKTMAELFEVQEEE